MSNPRRTRYEWYELITKCRQSGLSDAVWCYQNGINRHAFNSAIKRLRQKAIAIPERGSDDIENPPQPLKQDVVRVSILPDAPVSSADVSPMVPPHFDNSHTIKITFKEACIEISNQADPILLSKTLHLLRSMS